jgi:hypothetical protein
MSSPYRPEPTGGAGQDPNEVSAQEAARAIVRAAVTDGAAAPEPVQPPMEAGGEAPGDVGEQGVVSEEQVQELAAQTGLPFADVVEALADYGIGLTTDDIPAEAYPVVDKLLRSIQQGVTPLVEESTTARREREEIARFKERLAQKPESILLTLAVAQPEKWQEVSTIVERMQGDDDFRNLVIRELEVEARESRLQAQTEQQTQSVLMSKARRAVALTRQAAARHGVDPQKAERYVASMVTAEGPEVFDLNAIEGLVAELRPSESAPRQPRVMTPEQAAAQRQAPAAPHAGKTAPPPPTPPPAEQPSIKYLGGQVRKLVRNAGERVNTAIRGG